MSAKRKDIQPKWKVYTLLTLLIIGVTLAFDSGTLLASYPTEKHREVSRSLSALNNKVFSSGDPEKILESKEFKALEATPENTYSTRMSLASAALSVIMGIGIVAATYRYLRGNRITSKPIAATVLINTAASFVLIVPSLYMTEWLAGATVEAELLMLMLLGAPFALAFGVLITFLIAKVTEWHYNRSHGFIED